MTIIRAPRPASDFYILDKSISEDRRLGWGARALLIYLLGKPDHWEVSVQHLINQTADARRKSGRDQVYGFLEELQDVGYILKRAKRKEGGSFAGYEYVVSERPITEFPEMVPDPENPETVKALIDGVLKPDPENPEMVKSPDTENPETVPDTENPETDNPSPVTDSPDTAQPYTANPTQVSNESLASIEKGSKKQDADERRREREELVEAGFEIFYNAGLRKQKRQDTRRAWGKVVKNRKDPVAFAHELAEDIEKRILFQQLGIDKLHPATYLNGARWEDDLIDERNLWGAQKNPNGGNRSGEINSKHATTTERLNHESLYGKNYAGGATDEKALPEYLRD